MNGLASIVAQNWLVYQTQKDELQQMVERQGAIKCQAHINVDE